MIISSIDILNTAKFNKINPCRSRYFVNFYSDDSYYDEIFSITIFAIKKWLGELFKLKIPDSFNLDDDFTKKIENSSIRNDLMRCNAIYNDGEFTNDTLEMQKKILDLEKQIKRFKNNKAGELKQSESGISNRTLVDGIELNRFRGANNKEYDGRKPDYNSQLKLYDQMSSRKNSLVRPLSGVKKGNNILSSPAHDRLENQSDKDSSIILTKKFKLPS